MAYDPSLLGPALQKMRERKGLRQIDVGEKMGGIKASTVASFEKPGANPGVATLFRYLDAIEATLEDLERELRAEDALEAEIRRDDQRLESEPGYRDAYRRMFESLEIEPDDNDPSLRTVIEKLRRFEEHDKQLLELQRRVSDLEDPKGSKK